jgi:hypothetical protein
MCENPKASRWFGIPETASSSSSSSSSSSLHTESERKTSEMVVDDETGHPLLLHRFVDTDLGKNALQQVQTKEFFAPNYSNISCKNMKAPVLSMTAILQQYRTSNNNNNAHQIQWLAHGRHLQNESKNAGVM